MPGETRYLDAVCKLLENSTILDTDRNPSDDLDRHFNRDFLVVSQTLHIKMDGPFGKRIELNVTEYAFAHASVIQRQIDDVRFEREDERFQALFLNRHGNRVLTVDVKDPWDFSRAAKTLCLLLSLSTTFGLNG
jgi:hypothetical protein